MFSQSCSIKKLKNVALINAHSKCLILSKSSTLLPKFFFFSLLLFYRDEAKGLLENKENGSFLIRESVVRAGEFALALK